MIYHMSSTNLLINIIDKLNFISLKKYYFEIYLFIIQKVKLPDYLYFPTTVLLILRNYLVVYLKA